jgi:hypothetical protein
MIFTHNPTIMPATHNETKLWNQLLHKTRRTFNARDMKHKLNALKKKHNNILPMALLQHHGLVECLDDTDSVFGLTPGDIEKYSLTPADIPKLWDRLAYQQGGHSCHAGMRQERWQKIRKEHNDILPLAKLVQYGFLPLADDNERLVARYEKLESYKDVHTMLVGWYNEPNSYYKPTKIVCARDLDYHLQYHTFDDTNNMAFYVAETQPDSNPVVIGRAVSIMSPPIWMCSKKDEEAIKQFIRKADKQVAVIGI